MIRRRKMQLGIAAICLGIAGTACNTTAMYAGGQQSDSPTPIGHAVVAEPLLPQPIIPIPDTPRLPQSAPTEPTPSTSSAFQEDLPASVSAATPDKQVSTASDSQPPEDKQIEEEEAYHVEKPSLMGIRLSDTRATVEAKYAEPVGQFIMEDDPDPISVYAYNGFLIGFNIADTVEFIEVTSSDVNPGLNGLRLGHTIDDAEQWLGKPDINTNYTLHYKAGGTILKLDIDRKNESIISIKLFADTV